MTRFFIYLSVGIVICGQAYLAEAAAPTGSDVPETFLDADTIAVVRINFESLDVQGLRDWALSA